MHKFYQSSGSITLPDGTQKENSQFMSMEFCTHGDLGTQMIKNGAITDEQLLKHLLVQICKGLDSLHTLAGHAHLDLKVENILIGDDYLLKICDFGFVHPVSEELT